MEVQWLDWLDQTSPCNCSQSGGEEAVAGAVAKCRISLHSFLKHCYVRRRRSWSHPRWEREKDSSIIFSKSGALYWCTLLYRGVVIVIHRLVWRQYEMRLNLCSGSLCSWYIYQWSATCHKLQSYEFVQVSGTWISHPAELIMSFLTSFTSSVSRMSHILLEDMSCVFVPGSTAAATAACASVSMHVFCLCTLCSPALSLPLKAPSVT